MPQLMCDRDANVPAKEIFYGLSTDGRMTPLTLAFCGHCARKNWTALEAQGFYSLDNPTEKEKKLCASLTS